MPELSVPGGAIHYLAEGPEDAATAVLVHGLCCDHRDWRAQVEHLAPRWRVVAPDLRGFGASRGEPAAIGIGTFGADVAALLEHLGIDRAVIAGHSMGCRVVLEAARLAPARVKGLVLVDGSRFAMGSPETARADVAAHLAASGGWTTAVSGLFEQMFVPSSDPALRKAIIERAVAVPPAVGETAYLSMGEWDANHMREALESVRVPISVLQSTYVNAARERVPVEPGDTNAWFDFVREHAPAARIEVAAGVGHFTQCEAPGAVNDSIEDLLRKAG